MSTLRRITSGIVHLLHEGRPVTLRPGDLVPEWANITNPALFAGAAPVEPATAPESGEHHEPQGAPQTPPATGEQQTPPVAPHVVKPDDTPEVSIKMQGDELRGIALGLGLEKSGTKPQLVERILAKKAEIAASVAAAQSESTPASADADRAALEERARALEVEFDEDTTDEELTVLVEDAEE